MTVTLFFIYLLEFLLHLSFCKELHCNDLTIYFHSMKECWALLEALIRLNIDK